MTRATALTRAAALYMLPSSPHTSACPATITAHTQREEQEAARKAQEAAAARVSPLCVGEIVL